MSRDEPRLHLKHLRDQDVTLLVCGSMNPTHNYHLEAIRTSRRYLEECGCRSVRAIISPVADAYEKSDLVSAEHRLRMAELAVEEADLADWVEVDDRECRRQGWTPTLSVLNYHRERLKGGRRLILLVGSDIANSFVMFKPSGQPVWNPIDVREIIARYGMVIIRRLGHNISADAMAWLEASPKFEANVAVVEMPTAIKLISSSNIRQRLRDGLSADGFANRRVLDYIKEQHLYAK